MADNGAFEQVYRRTMSDSTFGNDMLSVLNGMRAEGVLLDVTVVAGEDVSCRDDVSNSDLTVHLFSS
ncbi:Hypp2135 [Branchiostoma lanceolatum]|uniref:Hypp2135 protein n=1 Tax=Branchiostoma lanceolatum TaxID=7740 RepID=A0A8K0ENZ9_BRALA|nr:Hypp2135 [Branchiostoma lanceolatum]